MADPVPTETLTMNYEKVEWTYSKSDADGDSFDFTAAPEEQEVGLLLPAVQAAREAARTTDERDLGAKDDGGAAYEYKLDGVMISSYDVGGSGDGEVSSIDALLIINDIGRSAADSDHDKWIDILTMSPPVTETVEDVVKNAGLRSDGELVQAVSEMEMPGDFIL